MFFCLSHTRGHLVEQEPRAPKEYLEKAFKDPRYCFTNGILNQTCFSFSIPALIG